MQKNQAKNVAGKLRKPRKRCGTAEEAEEALRDS